MSYDEFMKLSIFEVTKKISSIPKTEPLYDIIKSRTIKPSKIKNKEERKYWQEMKKANKIPQIYLSDEEINNNLKEKINGNRFN